MKKITTCINDIWYHNETNNEVVSSNSGHTYAANDLMLRLLESAKSNERSAERLKVIESAPVTRDGNGFLIEDKNYPGFFRAVEFDNVSFNWQEADYNNGVTLYSMSNADYFIHEMVVDPGEHYGPYYVYKYENEENPSSCLGVRDDLSSAMERLDDAISLKIKPLPTFFLNETTIVPLREGYASEVRVETCTDGGLTTHAYDIRVMDRFNREVCRYQENNPNKLFELRDSDELFEMEKSEKFRVKVDGILDLFRRVDPVGPSKFDDFCDIVDSSGSERVLKFCSADDEYELLIYKSDTAVVYRDTNGNFAFDGQPTIKKMQGLSGQIYESREDRFSVYIKKTDGVIYDKVESVHMNYERLYDLVMFADVRETIYDRHDEIIMSLSESGDNLEGVGEYPYPYLMVAGLNYLSHEIRDIDCKKTFIDVDVLRNRLQRNSGNSIADISYNY